MKDEKLDADADTDAERRRYEATRKANLRKSNKTAGLVRKDIWIKPEHWTKIQEYIKKLHEKQ